MRRCTSYPPYFAYIAITIGLMLNVASVVFADIQFLWYPNCPFDLGRGIDARDLGLGDTCFEKFETAKVGTGARLMSVRIQKVDTFEDVVRESRVDLAVAGKATFGVVTVDLTTAFDSFKKSRAIKSGLHYMLIVDQNFGEYVPVSLEFTCEAEKVKANGDPDEFANRYGTHYIAQAVRRASLVAHMEVRGISRDRQRQLSGDHSGGVNVGSFAELDSTGGFLNRLRELERGGNVDIKIFASGGDGTAPAADITTIDKAVKFMDDYTKTVSANEAPYVEFLAVPFSRKGVEVPSVSERQWGFYRRAFLLDTAFDGRLLAIKEEIDALQRGNSQPKEIADAFQYLKGQQQLYTSLKIRLANLAEEAKQADFDLAPLGDLEQQLQQMKSIMDPLRNSELITDVQRINGLVDKIGVSIDVEFHFPETIQSFSFSKQEEGSRHDLNDVGLRANEDKSRYFGMIDNYRAGIVAPLSQEDRDEANSIKQRASQSEYFLEIKLRNGMTIVESLGSPNLTDD